jgi:hypothetical protein
MTPRPTALFLLLALLPVTAPASDVRAAQTGPVLAVEDTMRTEISEVMVHAQRVTLDEILNRVHRGEMRRDSLLRDQSYLQTVRLVRNTDEKHKPQLIQETVDRVYMAKPGKARAVRLRDWKLKPPKKDADGEDKGLKVTVDSDMSEEIVNFAFRPENRGEFKFRIEGRELLGEHLIYRIHFEPRSALDVYAPSGLVWVDTREYVIVRESIEFRQSPVPLFMKGVRAMVVERQRSGDFWVLSRVLARIELTIPVPGFGRAFDFGIQYADYRINQGIPDSMFAAVPAGKPEVKK